MAAPHQNQPLSNSGSKLNEGAQDHSAQNPLNIAVDVESPDVSQPNVPSQLQEDEGIVFTEEIREITERALTYLEACDAVHLYGPPGCGKTTLALRIAASIGQKIVLIQGSAGMSPNDLVGQRSGWNRSTVVDNFIHSVSKVQESTRLEWKDSHLFRAIKNGYTVVYDEFNRASPEVNNVLLSVLSEGILFTPHSDGGSTEPFVRIHPNFRIIFTSNPEDYAGVHSTSDALCDRFVSINVSRYRVETEAEIIRMKGGVDFADALTLAQVGKKIRESIGLRHNWPSLRSLISIATVLRLRGGRARPGDEVFRWAISDIFNPDQLKPVRQGDEVLRKKVENIIHKLCKTEVSGGESAA